MKKITTFLSVLMLTFSLSIFADCKKNVQIIKAGQKAPCEGFLFSKTKEKQIRQEVENHKITLEDLRIQKDMTELYKNSLKETEFIVEKESKKSELWRSRAEKSTFNLIELEAKRGKRDLLFFGLGLLTTGIAAYTLNKTIGK